jgi:regulator of protease activity HflC (stomatin/prohibitin superfamily)
LVFVYPHQLSVVVSVLRPEGIRPESLDSGLHWVVPLAEKAVLYPRYWQTYTMSHNAREDASGQVSPIVTRTLDNQEVTIDVSVIFRLDPERLVDLHRHWQGRYRDELLRPLVRAYLRREVSRYTVDEVNSSQRNQLEQGLDETVKIGAAEQGLIVLDVLLRNIAFSKEYAESVEQKQVAEQGQQLREYQARQIENLARGEASKIRIVADADAEAIRVKAEARARARVIRAQAEAQALNLVAEALRGKQNLLTYLYIERLSPNVKAVVLPHDLPLIFPLPDLNPPVAPPEQVHRIAADLLEPLATEADSARRPANLSVLAPDEPESGPRSRRPD